LGAWSTLLFEAFIFLGLYKKHLDRPEYPFNEPVAFYARNILKNTAVDFRFVIGVAFLAQTVFLYPLRVVILKQINDMPLPVLGIDNHIPGNLFLAYWARVRHSTLLIIQTNALIMEPLFLSRIIGALAALAFL
jgi:hypothetical protein